MAAGVHGRSRSLPGWLPPVAVATVVALVALLAGVGVQYLPLIVGGALAAVVAGAPRREED